MNPLITALQRNIDGTPGELRERIRMLESALESMGDGVVVVDQQGQFLLCNSAARRIYGRDPVQGSIERWAELYGVFLPDRLTPFPGHQLPLARALRGELTDQIELFFRNPAHPDGIFVESTARPLRDPDHQIRGGIVVMRDVSLHKQAEVELRETNNRLSLLVAEQARRVEQSRLLAEMSSLLQATATVDELYAVVSDFVERLFPSAHGAFFAYSASRDDLEQKAAWGTYAALQESLLIKPTECWGLRRGRAHRLDAPGSRMRCGHIKSSTDGSICAPVLGPDETIGLLHLRFDDTDVVSFPSPWEEREHLAVTAAEYIGLSLVNLRLRMALQQQSIRDPLTGLFNRRFLEETLIRELRRAQRAKTTVCVLMLDIDYFKQFNDRYGHAAGDIVLREFASVLNDGSRGADVVSRYGGEEFTVLLPDTTIEGGRAKAEKVLEQTRLLRLSFNGVDIGAVTTSIGLAAYPASGEHAEDLLGAADAALYAAKQGGRDRLVISTRAATAGSPSASV